MVFPLISLPDVASKSLAFACDGVAMAGRHSRKSIERSVYCGLMQRHMQVIHESEQRIVEVSGVCLYGFCACLQHSLSHTTGGYRSTVWHIYLAEITSTEHCSISAIRCCQTREELASIYH